MHWRELEFCDELDGDVVDDYGPDERAVVLRALDDLAHTLTVERNAQGTWKPKTDLNIDEFKRSFVTMVREANEDDAAMIAAWLNTVAPKCIDETREQMLEEGSAEDDYKSAPWPV